MSIFDKRMAKEKRESLECAEDSRECDWKYPSFMSRLFQGAVEWQLVHPFPEQSEDDEQKGSEFLSTLEDFLKKNLDPDAVDETREIPKEVIEGLFRMGAFAVKIPKEYGGLGLSQTNYNKAVHLLGSYCGSTAALISAHQSIGVPQPLILFGTPEQKKKYLPMFGKGAISGFALTEPGVGSDPRNLQTTAVPTEDGAHYIINGEKLWCTNGNIADVLLVMAQTPPKIINGKEKKQITAFIVETKTPGFEVAYRCKFMGLNAIQNGVLKFTNVKVPKENIVLGEGEGLKLAFITLNTGRLTLPAAVTGMSKWCLYVARNWSKERKQWGCPIGEHEAIATMLANMASTVFAMEAITWMVSYMADNKKFDIRLEAAAAKVFCTEESWKIVNQAVQIRGGSGYETGPSLEGRGKTAFPLERALRDCRVNTILEGTSEVMRLFIAREALDFHLKAMGQLFDPKASIVKKLTVALSAGVRYMLWYPGLWIPCFGADAGAMTGPLNKHVKFIRHSSRRLAREVFHKMAIYQKGLVNKQNILNRFVDISIDLFTMASACSYAESLLKKGGKKENSVGLADLYCREATERIKSNFRKNNRNNDRQINTIARNLLDGKFDWLESYIIK